MWMIALGVIVFATGCPEGGPKVYPVSGTVKINGEPAKDVTINFSPIDTTGVMAGGPVTNGSYELFSGSEGKKGAAAGKYKVYLTVNAASAQSPEAMAEKMKGGTGGTAASASTFPEEFGSAQTTKLEKEVTKGSNKIDIVIP